MKRRRSWKRACGCGCLGVVVAFVGLIALGSVLPPLPKTAVPTSAAQAVILAPTDLGVAAQPSATITDTPVPLSTNTPVPAFPTVAAFNEQEYVARLHYALSVTSGNHVEVISIRVADGRAANGEITAIIAFSSSQTTGDGLTSEVLGLLAPIAVAIQTYNLDIDTVGMVVGAKATGIAVAALSVKVRDLMLFYRGEMTGAELSRRIEWTVF